MKPRDLQFDLRKNPGSPGVHGLRLVVSSSVEQQQIGLENAQAEVRSLSEPRVVDSFQLQLAETRNEATGTGRREPTRLLTVEEVASLLHVPVSWVYGRMRKRSPERLPSFRLGKYWRFSEVEVLEWLKHQMRGMH